ncbi:cell death abnormality protein 1-like [Haliotis rufescens]|uniref:cell death abnormality protein 1-like n=1 Tax=Haliotis rufescens TaxID=6454 RepID=UPI00201E8549|nr:cell death abnormality protein 1-like [Haliotis rufescens]
MLFFQLFLHVLFIEWITGTPHCSISDTRVHCHPCTSTCDPRNNTCFKCPKHCDRKSECTSVCSDKCIDKACEYIAANPKCSVGCQKGRTGSYCQEFCPDDCEACDQHTAVCTSCKDGQGTCSLSGPHLCSVSDANVNCLPCSEVCNPSLNKCFSCPKQCGKSIPVETCDSVCNENCLNGKCEYESGKLKCSSGCENGRTGISCQEFCPPKCISCDQFTSVCTQYSYCTRPTKPNCFDECLESSITENQCELMKKIVFKEHSACLARKTENISVCIDIIKETLKESSCSFECVQQFCTLNFNNCSKVNLNDDSSGQSLAVWLISGFVLFAVLAVSCLIIICIKRHKKRLQVIESDFQAFPEAVEDEREQDAHFTFALGAIGV